jgi:hypothetical protein
MAPAQQAASLYELALSALQPPVPLQISLATLISAIGSLIDVLLDRQIAATVWVKQPPGSAWLSEIERYRQQAGSKIYLCLEANTAQEAAAGVDHLSGELLPDLAQAQVCPQYHSCGLMADKIYENALLAAEPLHSPPVRRSPTSSFPAAGAGGKESFLRGAGTGISGATGIFSAGAVGTAVLSDNRPPAQVGAAASTGDGQR